MFVFALYNLYIDIKCQRKHRKQKITSCNCFSAMYHVPFNLLKWIIPPDISGGMLSKKQSVVILERRGSSMGLM